MNKSTSELKRLARGVLLGQYSSPILACLIIFLISFGLNLILIQIFPFYSVGNIFSYFLCSFIIEILITLLNTGLLFLLLNIARGSAGFSGDLFFVFKNQPDKIILAYLYILGLCILYMLPSFVLLALTLLYPALLFLRVIFILILLISIALLIVHLLSYVLVPYLYFDHPELGTLELLKESRTLMKGQKGRFFYLFLSFFGLLLLSAFTFFIGLLWIIPYMYMSFTEFYRDIIQEI